MFSYSTGYYVSPPDDQHLKFKNRCSLVTMYLEQRDSVSSYHGQISCTLYCEAFCYVYAALGSTKYQLGSGSRHALDTRLVVKEEKERALLKTNLIFFDICTTVTTIFKRSIMYSTLFF